MDRAAVNRERCDEERDQQHPERWLAERLSGRQSDRVVLAGRRFMLGIVIDVGPDRLVELGNQIALH